MNSREILQVAAAVLICMAAGIIGSAFTSPAIPNWYASLVKPEFTPPSWVFGPVWTTLYFLMGVSLYLIWKRKDEAKPALAVFSFQLVLNALWSFLFFGLQSPLYGLICIVLLWLAIVATVLLFYRISKTAAYLLVPYLLWVSFAAFLNYSIWTLN